MLPTIAELVESTFKAVGGEIPPALPAAARQEFIVRVQKAYGGFSNYEAYKQLIQIDPDQIARFEGAGVLMQPPQLLFAKWSRLCDLPEGPTELGMGGARGPGKSFALIAQVALDDCQRFPGLKVLYLRKIGKSAQEQLQDLVIHVLGNFKDKEVYNDRIVFGNGSVIMIGGFKDDNEALKYTGIEYDVLIIEETTQLKKETYATLRLAVRSSKAFNGVTWRPRVYNSTNPLGIGHIWYKQRFVDPERKRETELRLLPKRRKGKQLKPGDIFEPVQQPIDIGQSGLPARKFIFARVTDNVFVNPEYVQSLDELTGVQKRAFRDGDWDVSAGAYFETWRYDPHVIPPITDVSWMSKVWASMDYGFNHWNVIYLHAEDGDGVVYTLDELAHRKTYPDQIVPELILWLAKYKLTLDDLKTFKAGSDVFNKTGMSRYSISQTYRKLGVKFSPAETASGSRVGGAQYMMGLLGDPEHDIPPKWYVTTRCPGLIECMGYLERDPNNAEDVMKINASEDGSGGDDWYDGVRYGLYRPRASKMA